ncbi:hypothetical protein [Streptomyces griseoruber]
MANYSVISPYLMALFGVRTVSVASGLAATWLTASLLERAGVRRALGPALLGALMLWCDVAAGRTTFALGIAFCVAACRVALVCAVGWIAPGSLFHAARATGAPVPAWATHTGGVVRALRELGAGHTRVEVVPTSTYREAALLSPYVNLARGWNRQLDVERGRLFHDGAFSAERYRTWLDHWAVGLVVLPSAEPEQFAREEADLLRHHRPGWLTPVWHDVNWRIYRVRAAVPLVSAPARVLRMTGSEWDVRMPAPGSVTVRLAYSPWLRAADACLTKVGPFVRLAVSAPGDFKISSSYTRALQGPAC